MKLLSALHADACDGVVLPGCASIAVGLAKSNHWVYKSVSLLVSPGRQTISERIEQTHDEDIDDTCGLRHTVDCRLEYNSGDH